MIIKLASASSKVAGLFPKVVNKFGLGNFSKKLAKNPDLVSTLQNASLVPTIALGDGIIKTFNRKPGESRLKAFGSGAAEGALAGGIIAGGDQLIHSLAHHGKQSLNWMGR